MYLCECKFDNSIKYEYAYSLEEFDFNNLNAYTVVKKKNKKYQSEYINDVFTFDIETTSLYDVDKDVHYAITYNLQFCINEKVIFMKSWLEFQKLLDILIEKYNLYSNEKSSRKLVIYVHNLSYEFQFMNKFLELTKVFATDKRKVLTCVHKDMIEFRCSYRLSNMNLAKFIENTNNTHYIKMKEDLDYSQYRDPHSYMSIKEYGYCYNDVMGLYECIQEYLKEDTIITIPLTSTGFVRRDCRKAIKKNPKNRKEFLKNKLDLDVYLLLKECFRGGNASTNRKYTNKTLKNVYSDDMTSAYLFPMFVEKFPTKFNLTHINSLQELEEYNQKYATLGVYTFHNLELKDDVTIAYIPYDKVRKIKSYENYNGRILKAEYLTIALTEIDYNIIKSQYNYDELLIDDDFYFSIKKELPKELLEIVLKYFELKSSLKGNKEHYYEYMKAKNKLNSIYGMMITSLNHDDIIFENGEWIITENKDISKFYESRNSFLCYQWGVWITCYCRRNLQLLIDKIGKDVIYCDTDSCKHFNKHDKEVKEINDLFLSWIDDTDIKPIVNVNNKKYIMGLYDRDGQYSKFKTLGSKKYCYVDKNDNKIHATISGCNKDVSYEIMNEKGFDYFHTNAIFKDAKPNVWYNDSQEIYYLDWDKEKRYPQCSSIAIENGDYTLGITLTMLEILNKFINIY